MIGKAAIFLKHRAGKIGSKVGGMFRGRDLKNKVNIAKFKAKKAGLNFVKKNPVLAVNSAYYGSGLLAAGAVFGSGVATGSMLGLGTNKKGMNKEIKKIQQEKKSGKKNTTKDLTNRLARSQRY